MSKTGIFRLSFVFLAVVSLGISSSQASDSCRKVRAAYDVGTSSIKLSVKLIDVCQSKIIKDLYSGGKVTSTFAAELKGATIEQPRALDLDWWSKNGLATFEAAKKFVTEQVAKVSDENGAPYQIDEHVGVATHVFRTCSNCAELLKKDVLALGIDIRIISQAREGELEFAGVARTLREGTDLSTVASWGIGDGSQQFVTQIPGKSGELKPAHYVSSMAAGTFKNALIEKLGRSGDTPNPISLETNIQTNQSDYTVASDLVDTLFNEAVAKNKSANFVAWMTQQHPVVYGVGGIHTGAIKGLMKIEKLLKSDDLGSFYEIQDLATALKNVLGMTDGDIVEKMNPKEFDGKTSDEKIALRANEKLLSYAKTQVSSMILVYRTARRLDVSRVYISNADGTGEIYSMPEFAPQAESQAAQKPAPVKKAEAKPALPTKSELCGRFVVDHARAFGLSTSAAAKAKSTMGTIERANGTVTGCIVQASIGAAGCKALGMMSDANTCYGIVDIQTNTSGTRQMMVYIPLK